MAEQKTMIDYRDPKTMIVSQESEISIPLTWRTSKGEEIPIREMESKHLFFCVRMLWNHSCPPHLRFEPFKRWNLNRPVKYWTDRLPLLLVELQTRGDLDSWMINQLNQMVNHTSPRVEDNRVKGLVSV